MAQCQHHDQFMEVALNFNWILWEHGTATDCERYPEQVPIWLRPCPWDDTQKEPMGCLCCTDLHQALTQYHLEMDSWVRSGLLDLETWAMRNRLVGAGVWYFDDDDRPDPREDRGWPYVGIPRRPDTLHRRRRSDRPEDAWAQERAPHITPNSDGDFEAALRDFLDTHDRNRDAALGEPLGPPSTILPPYRPR